MKKVLSIALTIMLMILMPSCKDKEDEVSPCRIAANGAISMASMFEYRNVYLDGIKLTWSMGKITSIALIDANDDIYNVSGMMAVRDTTGFYYHNEFVTTGQYNEKDDEFIILKDFSYIDSRWEKSADNPLWY